MSTTGKRLPFKQYVELLVVYVRPEWRRALLLAILIATTIGLQLLNPQIVRYFIDTAGAGGALASLLWAGAAFLAGALLLQITQVAATYVGEDVGWRTTNALRADLALHCLKLDMSFHNDRTPGEMIERVDGDVANLAIFFAQFIIRVVGSLLLLLAVLLVLAFEDWRVSAAMTVYAIITVTCFVLVRRVAVPHWKRTREVSAELFGFLEEQLAGTEDIRSSGASAYTMRELYRYNQLRLAADQRAGLMNSLLVTQWFSLQTLGLIVALVAGFLLYQTGAVTIGAVYLIVAYANAIFWPLESLTEQIQNLQKAGASVERVHELYRTSARITGGNATLPAGPLAVKFDDVSFAYQNDAPGPAATPGEAVPGRTVLHNISFELAPGEVLGLLGRTGSGKTTITRLLFRLYDPISGTIRLSNQPDAPTLRELDLDELHRHVGIVTQDVQIFRASVRDNLTFFDHSYVPDSEIIHLLEEIGLGPWFHTLANGLDTELESGGTGLSAGEAQLLAFARVFLKNPGLVVLDEASSRLDPATEQLIERAVDRLLHNRTAIIVAHRLGTVQRADKIMILEAGQVREFGRYAELASNPQSRFAELLQAGMEEVLA